MKNLTHNSRTYRLSDPIGAGTDAGFVALAEIDMKNYSDLRVIIVLGTVVATGVVTSRVKNYAAVGAPSAVGSTVGVITSPVTGIATVASDTEGLVMHEVHRPQHRYVTVEYKRTVANTIIDSVIVELFNALEQPVAQAGADVHANEVLNAPLPSAV